MTSLALFDPPADGAEVFAGPANDSGDLLLVLACVHGLDHELVPLLLPASADALGSYQLSDHRRFLPCHRNLSCFRPNHSGYLRLSNLTGCSVIAIIMGNPGDGGSPSCQASSSPRRTPVHQEESAAMTVPVTVPPAQNLAKIAAQISGTAATICVNGLIEYPTDDGPEFWACHGCAGCQTHPSQFVGPRRDRTAESVSAVFAASDADVEW